MADSPARRLTLTLLRFGLAAIFIVAGALKWWESPETFADSIASFQTLPRWAIHPVALGLPLFEIVVGVVLLFGRPRRLGAFCVLMMSFAFLAALAFALVRGIAVECGCFGGGPTWLPLSAKQQVWFDLFRDAALALGALILYRHEAASKLLEPLPR